MSVELLVLSFKHPECPWMNKNVKFTGFGEVLIEKKMSGFSFSSL